MGHGTVRCSLMDTAELIAVGAVGHDHRGERAQAVLVDGPKTMAACLPEPVEYFLEGVDVQDVSGKGRGLVTTQPIKTGTLVRVRQVFSVRCVAVALLFTLCLS